MVAADFILQRSDHRFGIGDARRLQASVTDQIVGHSLTPMAASISLQPDHPFDSQPSI
jgi:hypothetical protein